jgi:hypothetical protein
MTNGAMFNRWFSGVQVYFLGNEVPGRELYR